MDFINNLIGINNQSGGGGSHCSLCKSSGVRKSTCPLNPKAKNPNPKNHPLAKKKKPSIKIKKKTKVVAANKRPKSPKSTAKMSSAQRQHQENEMTVLINSYIAHKQYAKLNNIIATSTLYPKPLAKLNHKLKTLKLKIDNMPEFRATGVGIGSRRAARRTRAKTKFSPDEIILDPAAAGALRHIISSVHASPGFVKQAETVHRDMINLWITDNADKYDII